MRHYFWFSGLILVFGNCSNQWFFSILILSTLAILIRANVLQSVSSSSVAPLGAIDNFIS